MVNQYRCRICETITVTGYDCSKEMNYTKATEVPNTKSTDPNAAPLLALGFVSSDGKELSRKLGVRKYMDILSVLDDIKAEIDAFNPEKGIFRKEVKFHEGEKYGQWSLVFSRGLYELFNHYRADIQTYIDKYYVPYVPAGREAITEPFSEMVETDNLDIKWKLLVPCYDKRETDTGEGLIPWAVSEFFVRLLVRDGELGMCFANIKKHVESGATSEYKFTHNIRGEDKEMVFTIEQCKAFIKYYDAFLKFAINPVSLSK